MVAEEVRGKGNTRAFKDHIWPYHVLYPVHGAADRRSGLDLFLAGRPSIRRMDTAPSAWSAPSWRSGS